MSEWISVEERLPEGKNTKDGWPELRRFLVIQTFFEDMVQIATYSKSANPAWAEPYWKLPSVSGGNCAEYVTHWMPMPAPPEAPHQKG